MLCKKKKPKKKVVGPIRRSGRKFAPSPFVAQACSGAIKLAADPSLHLLGGFFSVCRDLVALRRNPIRSIASRDPICRKSRKIDGFYRISRRCDTIEPNKKIKP